jgi:hypothetical protein
MKIWPKEFIIRIGREILFGTCFIFTLTVLSEYFIQDEELSGRDLVSSLAMGLLLSGLMIALDWKAWKEKLASSKAELTKS